VVAPLGVNTGRIRITEAVALSTSDALVVVPPKDGDADPTVRLGDTIHALNDEPVTDLQEFDLRLRTAYRNLAPGRSLSVVFGRGGALTEKRWRKPTETQ
jgi:S1-C subfamily serine protease